MSKIFEALQNANSELQYVETSDLAPVAAKDFSLNNLEVTMEQVINAGDGKEEQSEYNDLYAELKRDLLPVGRMEILFVEKIALNYWRLRRLIRYETGEIRERLDNFRENALWSHYSSYSRQRPNLEYYSYKDKISDTEYLEQQSKVASMRSHVYNLAEEKVAQEYVLCWRMERDNAGFSDKDYKAAKKYVVGLSPQMKGKLRKEMLEEAEQVLAEMDEVRTWQVKFDRIQKAKSLPVERDINNIIKYENSLERSIFRNLAALKTLKENRAGARDKEGDRLELPVSCG